MVIGYRLLVVEAWSTAKVCSKAYMGMRFFIFHSTLFRIFAATSKKRRCVITYCKLEK